MGEIKIDQIIRSSRKSISLEFTHDARVVIRAPHRVSMEYIQGFVYSKSKWIEKNQKQAALKPGGLRPKKFETGEKFYLLGKEYILEIIDAGKPAIWIDGNLKMSKHCLLSPQTYLARWYAVRATQILTERVKLYSLSSGLNYKSIRINSARTRWGSCGPNNTLNFSWRLVAASVEAIDSVVVHELVHTEIKNHSRKFYQKLGSILPDFKERERWLKENRGAFLF